MIIIDDIVYDSYLDMCKAYDIDCKDFFKYKRRNLNMSEPEILDRFIPNLGISMLTGNYVSRKIKACTK